MSFLRLGTACVVLDDDGKVLLSRRGDIDVWNLPTGRLDANENLAEASTREVFEETGVRIHIDSPVGLYYLEASQRLNVLFSGFPIGGELQRETEETRDNRYFELTALPQNVFAKYMVDHAVTGQLKMLHILTTPPAEIRRIRRKLAWRWVKNFLRGKPEPRHMRFDVRSVGLIWDASHQRVLTVPGAREQVLPHVVCHGNQSPWDELVDGVYRWFQLRPKFHWVGIWQNPQKNQLEFVFATTVNEKQVGSLAEWTMIQNAALMGRDALYVQQVKSNYISQKIWHIVENDHDMPVDVISRNQ